MSDIYLDQNYRELCETKLNALRQTKSAATYSVEFATLPAPLSLNDEALCLNFYRGLHDDVKDRMAIVGRASTYDTLVKQAISIDQRSHQRRLESKSESGSSNGSNKSRSPTNTRNARIRPSRIPLRPTPALNASNPSPAVLFPKKKKPVEKGLTSAPTVPIRNTVLQTAPPLLLRKPKSVLFRSRFHHLIIPNRRKTSNLKPL